MSERVQTFLKLKLRWSTMATRYMSNLIHGDLWCFTALNVQRNCNPSKILTQFIPRDLRHLLLFVLSLVLSFTRLVYTVLVVVLFLPLHFHITCLVWFLISLWSGPVNVSFELEVRMQWPSLYHVPDQLGW